jgi:hypothetical protein
MPRKFALSDELALWPFGIGTIVLMRRLSATVPCIVMAENKNAICVKQSSPALIMWSEEKLLFPSLFPDFSLETAVLMSFT